MLVLMESYKNQHIIEAAAYKNTAMSTIAIMEIQLL